MKPRFVFIILALFFLVTQAWAGESSGVNGFFQSNYVKADIYSYDSSPVQEQQLTNSHGYFKPRSARRSQQQKIRSYPGRFKRNSRGVVTHPVEIPSEWDVSNALQ